MFEVLINEGGVTDTDILLGALLHDTVEDTSTTFEEIEEKFGAEVRKLVEECTDDKSLSQDERKQRQIETAPHKSPKAKNIKIADKISNLRDMIESPPANWSRDRKSKYVEWSRQVVEGLRGANPALDAVYDQTYEQCLARLKE